MKIFELIDNSVLIGKLIAALSENARADFLAKQYGDKLQNIQHDPKARGQQPEQLIQELSAADPTSNKKYLQFIVKMYVQGAFRLEDVNRLRDDLTTYSKFVSRMPVNQRNVLAFKSLRDLYNAIKPFQDTEEPVSGKQQRKMVKQEGAKKIVDTPNFKVLVPTTEEAACFYGKGTRWCTAANENNMFKHYSDQGDLYIIMAGDRKFQLHMESNQFMDEQDEDVNSEDIQYLSKFPEYKNFLNMMIQKYYMS